MTAPETTCWTVIREAAEGRESARTDFVRRYQPVVRAYLRARWKGTLLVQEVEDAVQEVFLDCFRAALGRAEEGRPGGFRAFFYGIARNVALMTERRRARRRDRPGGPEPDELPAAEDSLSVVFDRAFALGLVREAAALQTRRAAAKGESARRRVELLRLRFQEEMPIREIAKQWQEEAPRLHREYAKARKEFRAALLEVASFHDPGDPKLVERECIRLLRLFG